MKAFFQQFCFISILLSGGCSFLQFNESKNNKDAINPEQTLIQDIKDGHLDMQLEHASLIASGIKTQKESRSYQKKYDFLISRIEQETDIAGSDDPGERAKIIFNWLQNNANKGTYKNCYDIKNTLNLHVGNCLSYAIRFTILCRHFGIDIKNISIPGHIYNAVIHNGRKYLFEHTHSDGIVKSSDRHNPQKKIMEDKELIGEIFLYKAYNANSNRKYRQSTIYCKRAMLCNPEDKRPVILLLDNYIAEGKYNKALNNLDEYLSKHPNEKGFFSKPHKILKNYCKYNNQ